MAWCDLTGTTTTLHDVDVAIGADGFHKPHGNTAPIMGSGVDVAVIDALDDNLRFRDLHGHGTNMAGIIATNTSTEWGAPPAAGSSTSRSAPPTAPSMSPR